MTKIRGPLVPGGDYQAVDGKFVKGGFHAVLTLQQMLNMPSWLRILDAENTTVVYVANDNVLYELINEPGTPATTLTDWDVISIGGGDTDRVINLVGEWNADNTTPVLQDSGATGITGDAYVVIGAPSPTDVTHAGLFGGATKNVVNGDYVISVGTMWITLKTAVTWEGINKPQAIVDYVAGTVIAHTHDISDINGLQDELNLKFIASSALQRAADIGAALDAEITSFGFVDQNYARKDDAYTKTESDSRYLQSVPDHDSLGGVDPNDHIDHTGVALNGAKSISGGGDISANREFELVNDEDTPGGSKYYGTDSDGAKGFHELPLGGGTGSGVEYTITQAAHGFSVGNPVTNNGGTWQLARNDVDGSLACNGIVSEIIGVNEFKVTTLGLIDFSAGGTDGQMFYLDTTAGQAVNPPPSTGGFQQLYQQISSSQVFVEVSEFYVEEASAGYLTEATRADLDTDLAGSVLGKIAILQIGLGSVDPDEDFTFTQNQNHRTRRIVLDKNLGNIIIGSSDPTIGDWYVQIIQDATGGRTITGFTKETGSLRPINDLTLNTSPNAENLYRVTYLPGGDAEIECLNIPVSNSWI
jgi:hypothetical protein